MRTSLSKYLHFPGETDLSNVTWILRGQSWGIKSNFFLSSTLPCWPQWFHWERTSRSYVMRGHHSHIHCLPTGLQKLWLQELFGCLKSEKNWASFVMNSSGISVLPVHGCPTWPPDFCPLVCGVTAMFSPFSSAGRASLLHGWHGGLARPPSRRSLDPVYFPANVSGIWEASEPHSACLFTEGLISCWWDPV